MYLFVSEHAGAETINFLPLGRLIVIFEKSGLPIVVADDPLSTVAIGCGKALDNIDILKEVVID